MIRSFLLKNILYIKKKGHIFVPINERLLKHYLVLNVLFIVIYVLVDIK